MIVAGVKGRDFAQRPRDQSLSVKALFAVKLRSQQSRVLVKGQGSIQRFMMELGVGSGFFQD